MVELGEGQRGKGRKAIILIQGAIIGLGRNLVLEKPPGFHKNDPS